MTEAILILLNHSTLLALSSLVARLRVSSALNGLWGLSLSTHQSKSLLDSAKVKSLELWLLLYSFLIIRVLVLIEYLHFQVIVFKYFDSLAPVLHIFILEIIYASFWILLLQLSSTLVLSPLASLLLLR